MLSSWWTNGSSMSMEKLWLEISLPESFLGQLDAQWVSKGHENNITLSYFARNVLAVCFWQQLGISSKMSYTNCGVIRILISPPSTASGRGSTSCPACPSSDFLRLPLLEEECYCWIDKLVRLYHIKRDKPLVRPEFSSLWPLIHHACSERQVTENSRKRLFFLVDMV